MLKFLGLFLFAQLLIGLVITPLFLLYFFIEMTPIFTLVFFSGGLLYIGVMMAVVVYLYDAGVID